jgi:hypothetical protein
METAMNTMDPEINRNDHSLLITRLILRDVYLIIGSIQNLVAILLSYAEVGAVIANGLSRLGADYNIDEDLD